MNLERQTGGSGFPGLEGSEEKDSDCNRHRVSLEGEGNILNYSDGCAMLNTLKITDLDTVNR